MAKGARDVLELVGNTPLVRLNKLAGPGYAEVLCKLESLNPSGSIKDRVALALVADAEARGALHPGQVLLVATSGNTGISLAMVANARGYRLVVMMPENALAERRRLLARYGAETRLTPAYQGMDGAQRAAQELAEREGYVLLDPFRDPAVVRAHREATAREILAQVDGRIDAFVAGVGTGATVTGVGSVLKQRNQGTLVVAVEPASSRVLSGGKAGPHGIPGIGADFVPPLLERGLLDEIVPVTDEAASQTALRLARQEGLLVGISSGANVAAALKLAARLGAGKRVVTGLPDTGERYVNFPL